MTSHLCLDIHTHSICHIVGLVICVAPEVPELQTVGHLLARGGDEEVAELAQGVAEGQQPQGPRPLPRTRQPGLLCPSLLTLQHDSRGEIINIDLVSYCLTRKVSLDQAKRLDTKKIPICSFKSSFHRL